MFWPYKAILTQLLLDWHHRIVSVRGVLDSSWTVTVVTALVKEERGGQGHTSASLLHQSAMLHYAVNTHCFYMSAFSILCFLLSAMDGKIEQRVCIKFWVKLGKSATKPLEMLREAFAEHSLSRTAVFECHSRCGNIFTQPFPRSGPCTHVAVYYFTCSINVFIVSV
jgi:hypothetical protein